MDQYFLLLLKSFFYIGILLLLKLSRNVAQWSRTQMHDRDRWKFRKQVYYQAEVGTQESNLTRQRYPKREARGKVEKQTRIKHYDYDCERMLERELGTTTNWRRDKTQRENISRANGEWLDTGAGDTIRDQVSTDEEGAGQTGTWTETGESDYKIKQEVHDMKHEGNIKYLTDRETWWWNMTQRLALQELSE